MAPDGESFVLGAEWGLYRFDANGQKFWRAQVPGTTWGVNLSADGRFIVAAFGDGTIRWFRASDGPSFSPSSSTCRTRPGSPGRQAAITRHRPAAKI